MYLWIKAFHIIMVVSWFAGLFYLPRLFVNHAMATEAGDIARLKLMEAKLYRFITRGWCWCPACGYGWARA
jgi:putative membrane protein